MILLTPKLRRLRRESAPDADFKASLRSRLVADRPLMKHTFPVYIMRYTLATASLALIMFLGFGSYAYASTAVTEGDTLYPVKTTLEDIEGSFKRSPEARARFHAKIMRRRAAEIAYRVRHNEPLPPQLIDHLADSMSVTVDELTKLRHDEAGRELIKTNVKLEVTDALTRLRTEIELSNMGTAEKARYLRGIDLRIQKIADIPTTTPLE
ncbi:MAG TPA: DUF5667 domain-containing protein [bacterium]|nr:DUF5667 domain-containing protein [bacterium]